jgi:hydroxymethylglutaryl-CoA lyase
MEIIIHEVGMRDGLQIERAVVPTEVKIRWIEALIDSGVDIVQLGSFVHPGKVPQMADTDRLFAHFALPGKKSGPVALSGLVLNEKGLERGLACGVEQFCMGASASDTHSRKNTGMSTEEAVGRILAMARTAAGAGKPVQVSVQSAFGCGYEGPVPEERVLGIVRRYLEAGLKTISLADTAGHATPEAVERLFASVLALDPSIGCACHFHDTYGLAMANACAALRCGVRSIEAAFAGLGGCPFTATAAGNLCTEDFVHLLQRTGRRRDIRLDKLIATAAAAGQFLQRTLPGAVHRSGPIPEARPSAPTAPGQPASGR